MMRPSPFLRTWLPYRNCISAEGFTHTWGEETEGTEGLSEQLAQELRSHKQTGQPASWQ